jgi:hypothetical protein
MRKLTILMALASALAASSGCSSCIGRCRNLFHKGSPCGTAMAAPAVLGAPLAMGTPMAQPMMGAPMMAGPMCVPQAPMCMPVDPCMDQCVDPCADPCANGMVTMGYGGGGYATGGESCNCAGGDGGAIMSAPMNTLPPGTVVSPTPLSDQTN